MHPLMPEKVVNAGDMTTFVEEIQKVVELIWKTAIGEGDILVRDGPELRTNDSDPIDKVV
ncbi:hypothetical protein BGZ92_011809 [Podila epicladia]|nr:hypothetical protein BGZ92_011809 [Podila epicladia]